jgi:hypothetical protein
LVLAYSIGVGCNQVATTSGAYAMPTQYRLISNLFGNSNNEEQFALSARVYPTFDKACEALDRLERKYPNAVIDVKAVN